ncbi:Transcriptional activator RfaH [uncultured Gammaproteobacteria bacterium]|uniref:transcription termination/antitermination NusG family protein n=1 Tax=Bathymodiolus heckerae thiotrophic gill symbiont TaxID=1052212 RepID=UPI0010B04BCF|nr:transcription termination/antitermination NusG family protein [Bathymodiolus heckerae thiotrophic gill symbiont]CAC9538308.1 Transcriptional activator RfaH [uncultured Gammaproteobacteria bacterium]CAC9954049.1 Transcriptional activator RfaH [uncultured Gammaproteobacteria bacterium]SHN90817.1 Transcriptional activator RfaH [Bathymodiolus heckerae thiotrophic gill symbiont]
MKKWYLIQTKPQQESIAAKNLSNQDFDIFHPKAIINNKTVSLFPRYLFIQLDDKNQNWTPIRSTRGVANFVRFGLNFAVVPNKIIRLIKIQQQQTIEKLINICSHQKGDDIEIQSGVFKGQTAIFQNYNSRDRVIVLLKLIGQQQEIELLEKEVIAV